MPFFNTQVPLYQMHLKEYVVLEQVFSMLAEILSGCVVLNSLGKNLRHFLWDDHHNSFQHHVVNGH